MRLSFHPLVQQDINSILRRYDAVSPSLGDRFFKELMDAPEDILPNPHRGHIQERDVRRVNLPSFPFHFLYRIHPSRLRITIVKHNKRHPRVGLRRR